MATKSFGWEEFLKLADELGNGSDEASQRTALSRAYYFVYHLARQRAEGNGFKAVKGEATHTQLWRTFSESPDTDCRKLGEIAARLNENRRKADYEDVFPRLADYLDGAVADARAFSAKLFQLAPRLPNPKSIRQ